MCVFARAVALFIFMPFRLVLGIGYVSPPVELEAVLEDLKHLWTSIGEAVDCEVLVNATSVGFHAPGESVIPLSLLSEGKAVLDVVFMPPESRLVRKARARGCVAIPGTRMLVHQAAYQFELYTGQEAPLEAMEQALLETIEQIS